MCMKTLVSIIVALEKKEKDGTDFSSSTTNSCLYTVVYEIMVVILALSESGTSLSLANKASGVVELQFQGQGRVGFLQQLCIKFIICVTSKAIMHCETLAGLCLSLCCPGPYHQ
ncbi:hypothetical protein REPUB_Repub18cG0130300 [Reevesia pubescens]